MTMRLGSVYQMISPVPQKGEYIFESLKRYWEGKRGSFFCPQQPSALLCTVMRAWEGMLPYLLTINFSWEGNGKPLNRVWRHGSEFQLCLWLWVHFFTPLSLSFTGCMWHLIRLSHFGTLDSSLPVRLPPLPWPHGQPPNTALLPSLMTSCFWRWDGGGKQESRNTYLPWPAPNQHLCGVHRSNWFFFSS